MLFKALTNKEILIALGEDFKSERLRQNLTQEFIAEKVGISLSSVKKIERGESVSFNILLSYMRSLNLLEGLKEIVPDTVISPYDIERYNNSKRKKARKKNPAKKNNNFFE